MPGVIRMLGRPYMMTGTVVAGNHIGSRIGSPTANLTPGSGKVMPPYGVYAVRVSIDDQGDAGRGRTSGTDRVAGVYDGVANFGVKPTIGDDNPLGLEINIFDFDGDIYSEKISVYFYDFIRPERQFETVDELEKQIRTDRERAKDILAGTHDR